MPLTNHWLVRACLVTEAAEFNAMAIRLVQDASIEIVVFSIDSQDHRTTLVCWQISTPHLQHIGDIFDFSLADLTTPTSRHLRHSI